MVTFEEILRHLRRLGDLEARNGSSSRARAMVAELEKLPQSVRDDWELSQSPARTGRPPSAPARISHQEVE